ncbi:MAG: hypothetical protein ACFFCI_09000 [Promethearchaeota archaeon]
MTIRIDKSYYYSGKNNTIELDCKGKGTKDDPFIIDGSVALPNSVEINESDAFIYLINCRISKLGITISKNITIKNSYIEQVWLSSCRDVRILNCLNRTIGLEMSQNCVLDGCKIERGFSSWCSSYNVIKNCTIKKIWEYNIFGRCKDNVFENNKIPEKYLAKLKRESMKKFNNNTTQNQIFSIIESDPDYVECTGTGFKEDPFIFMLQDIPCDSTYFSFLESVHYVHIKHYDLHRLFFGFCKNKFINDCDIIALGLNYCSNVKIQKSHIQYLRLGHSKNILVSNCIVENLKLKKSFNGGIIFENCTIDLIKGKNDDKIEIIN